MTTTEQPTPAASAALFRRLGELRDACGATMNKHEAVRTMIKALIADEGINERRNIIGVLHHIGFNRRHVALLLQDGTGDNPRRHSWQRDREGRYSLHPE
jgi:hypothetical protein